MSTAILSCLDPASSTAAGCPATPQGRSGVRRAGWRLLLRIPRRAPEGPRGRHDGPGSPSLPCATRSRS